MDHQVGLLHEFYAGERVSTWDIQSQSWFSWTISERRGPKSYIVCFEEARLWRRHIDQLRHSESHVKDERESDIVWWMRKRTVIKRDASSDTNYIAKSAGSHVTIIISQHVTSISLWGQRAETNTGVNSVITCTSTFLTNSTDAITTDWRNMMFFRYGFYGWEL